MTTKSAQAEALQKKQAKIQKEIQKWEREKQKPRGGGYLAFLILIICVVYITDEVASQISTFMKTEIASDLLSKYGERSIGVLDILSIVAFPFQGLSLLYKPLADKYGRKRFMILNTFGMGVAMLLIFLSDNLILYIAGSCISAFFVPHDMQVVYIMESAPPKHRAKLYSSVKCVATLGVMLIPLFRRLMMSNASEWRIVYLAPAVMGLAVSLAALLTLRETDAFIESRLKYLNMTEEQRMELKRAKDSGSSQGGFISALKFVYHHKQLRWLYAAVALGTVGVLVTMQYQAIISYGYAQAYLDRGLFTTIDAALDAVSVGEVTSALFLCPVGSALFQLIHGFISDRWGRKYSAVILAASSLISLILFSLGAKYAWNPYFVGFFSGACIGSFWGCTDVNGLMVSESSPTNLRSSIMSTQMLAIGAGYIVAYCVGLPLITYFGNSSIATVSLCLAVPGLALSLLALIFKTHETKGVDLETVRGDEWD